MSFPGGLGQQTVWEPLVTQPTSPPFQEMPDPYSTACNLETRVQYTHVTLLLSINYQLKNTAWNTFNVQMYRYLAALKSATLVIFC